MPGTVIRDATAPNLLTGATLNSATTSNGTGVELLWPGEITFELALPGTITGTNPTISVDIQGCETSDFSTADVVTLGTLYSAGTGETNKSYQFTTYVDAKYVRAAVVTGGTNPVYTGATLTPVPQHDRRRRGAVPTSKALV